MAKFVAYSCFGSPREILQSEISNEELMKNGQRYARTLNETDVQVYSFRTIMKTYRLFYRC